eukprot:NODE_23024_length_684_cov_0.976661.p4 GENE.NODE_23024_length_684_cov_0.976661~~NODE_23024_length_684_cov_0.976661.p4  ORF type:complete len:128 (-),score=2.14 NODE_23024_length_684_cov_0.976661:163-546(-)
MQAFVNGLSCWRVEMVKHQSHSDTLNRTAILCESAFSRSIVPSAAVCRRCSARPVDALLLPVSAQLTLRSRAALRQLVRIWCVSPWLHRFEPCVRADRSAAAQTPCSLNEPTALAHIPRHFVGPSDT